MLAHFTPSQKHISRLAGFAIFLFGLSTLTSLRAEPFAYVPNAGSNNVSVIDTATNTVLGTIPVGALPIGVAVAPDGSKAYIANFSSNNVSVINTSTKTVTATVPVGATPTGVAVTPDGSKVYVANEFSNKVYVIDSATNTVVGAPIPVGALPIGVAITPDGSKVYVSNRGSNDVYVIATATNTVVGTIPLGVEPQGVAVTPDGSKVYVANSSSNNVSVIATSTNTVVGAPIPVGAIPVALGAFIAPIHFYGQPGSPNCHGSSASALTQQFGGLAYAVERLGYASVNALQDAIKTYCGE
ncbi:MAG: beta-propeller fold lactonase family protein [Methylocystis sp.]|jgi:YVTN family beta-propeller protein